MHVTYSAESVSTGWRESRRVYIPKQLFPSYTYSAGSVSESDSLVEEPRPAAKGLLILLEGSVKSTRWLKRVSTCSQGPKGNFQAAYSAVSESSHAYPAGCISGSDTQESRPAAKRLLLRYLFCWKCQYWLARVLVCSQRATSPLEVSVKVTLVG